MSYNVLQINPDGEGHTKFNLGSAGVELVTRFNYSIPAWTLDVVDVAGATLVAGIPMLPGFDLLKPHPDIKALIGGLMMVEQVEGSHRYPDLLSESVQLLWFPVGTPVVYP